MKKNLIITKTVFLLALSFQGNLFCQKEASQWYFGKNLGLSFLTSPPTLLSVSTMTGVEGCASIADGSGNLLFYTDGETVYNKQHQVMPNGTGLGNTNTYAAQGALIVKQPGSLKHYYIFTPPPVNSISLGFRYTVVDMSLSAGSGSVISKNILLHPSSSEKVSAVNHCNNQDVWIISHDTSNVFRSYLLTSSGINTVAILSSFANNGIRYNGGYLKAAPLGNRIALSTISSLTTTSGAFELFDFDNATGMVTNPILLLGINYAYGCEFSADGSKLYGTQNYGGASSKLYQWDICSGQNNTIINSRVVIDSSVNSKFGLQLAPDKKIYVAKLFSGSLGVIQNPSSAGLACGYVDQGLSVGSGTVYYGLPNFNSSLLRKNTADTFLFQHTPHCFTSFTSQSCSGQDSIHHVWWDFGDTGSGAASTSSLSNPLHRFSSPGNYTVQLIRQYKCYADTIRQVVPVPYATPNLSVSGSTSVCLFDKRVLTVSGADTFSWSTGEVVPSIFPKPAQAGLYSYTVTGINSVGNCSASAVFTLQVLNCVGLKPEVRPQPKFFPSPVTANSLNIDSGETLTFVITNQLGNTEMEGQLNPGANTISLKELPDGVFLFSTLSVSGERTLRKILKMTAE